MLSSQNFRSLVSKYEKLEYPSSLGNELVNLLLTELPAGFIQGLAEKYPLYPGVRGVNKYIHEYDFYILQSIKRAVLLKLHQRDRLNILDIGSGVGWFAFICTKLGHTCIGLDEDSEALYTETFSLLGFERYIHRIMPFQPLPNFREKFDLVTCFQICFNLYTLDNYDWGPGEWAYFIYDLVNQFGPTMDLFIGFNFHESDLHNGKFYSPLVKHWLENHGFILLPGGKVYFSPHDKQVPFKDWLDEWHASNTASLCSGKNSREAKG